jgi:hypothetical protein
MHPPALIDTCMSFRIDQLQEVRTAPAAQVMAYPREGPATVNDIVERLEGRVRIRLNMLRARGVVIREGRDGAHREFTYRLLRPGVAAKAVREKGLARAPPEPR